jgi:hypothetical protein
MAKYTVKCPACSTPYTVRLDGRQRDRQWKLDTWDWTCDDCGKKQRQEQNEKAAAENSASGMAPLTGTENQVGWAETIRKQKLASIEALLKEPHEVISAGWLGRQIKKSDPRIPAAIQSLKDQPSASWWIDHREADANKLLVDIASKADIPLPPAEAEVAKAAQAAATAEATVRPETPITETVAEIRVNGNVLEVYFPEKREDFWQIIKKQLRFEWSGLCWKRAVSTVPGGTPQDRAAETGNVLLAKGFPIRIFDEALRSRAIKGEFDPECRRWVKKRTAGDYVGWFSISWPREEDFYNAAKKLPGARYSKPDVVVPAEQFEQVQDFAEMYGFQLSAGAREIAETAKQIKDAALTARVEEREHAAPPVPGRKPRKLPVPENVPVADEFKEAI